MEIRDIQIDNVNIPDIQVYQPPGWTANPTSIFVAPPVTQAVSYTHLTLPTNREV